MVKAIMQWRLLFVLLLPTVAAFRPQATRHTCSSRIESLRVGPLYAAVPDEVADIATEVVNSPSSPYKLLVNQLTSMKPTDVSANEAIPENAIKAISSLTDGLSSLLHQQVETIQTLLAQINQGIVVGLASLPLDPIFAQMKETALAIGVSNEDISKIVGLINGVTGAMNTPQVIAATTVISYVVINSIITWGDSPSPGMPYPKKKYDAVGARIYFDQRPLQMLARSLTIASRSLSFALRLAGDKVRGDETWSGNQEMRGKELAQLLTELGPTFIKVGQSLSIRTDILSPAYIRGLSSLQDCVPAFDTATAKAILEEEWGVPVDQVLEGGLSDAQSPVAAASLGQVYKGKLKGSGIEVAIKVQRPDITNQIALDMHLLRESAPILRRAFNLNTDTEGTVDVWGTGFVDELDYLQEASNGKYFMEKIQNTTLKDVVLAPKIIDDYTSGKVLVTEWIDGERLDRSSSEDVTILCSICMNTYLTMLLEMGLLHCDPHPGNLLRTPDGKLCILDWGMVTSIPSQLQLTLIEHMAHLTSRDYAEVPRDLYLLGFVPADKEDVIEDSGVVDILADLYGQWTDGGGLKSINANDVLVQMQDLASAKGNLFQIPPYFAYIAKSFSVLEGIGLSNDEKYSIIDECLPYVSNRLVSDQQSMGNALNTFIFGPDKHNLDTRLVDAKRIKQLVSGFGDFAATSASGALSKPTTEINSAETVNTTASLEQLEQVADQVLDVVLTEEETPLQKILIEQAGKILAANTRSLWTEARERSGILPTGRTVLGTLVDPLGLFQTSPLVNTNDQDKLVVQMTQDLVEVFQSIQKTNEGNDSPTTGIDLQSLNNEEVLAFSRILSTKLWERRSAFVKSSNRFVNQLLELTAKRLESSERVPVGERTPTVGISADTNAGDSNDSSSAASSDSEKTATSSRLQEARDRLNTLTTQ